MKYKICAIILTVICLNLQAPNLPKPILCDNASARIEQYERDTFLDNMDDMPFSIENLYTAMVYVGIKNPEILLKQAYLESGGFTSELWMDYNNPFGMKHGKIRETTSMGPVMRLGYASYRTWAEAVRDMKHFQDYWETKGWDMEDYGYFLVNLPYATDKDYLVKLDRLVI